MISKFKREHCELFSNAPLPPDFNTFWKQASQQGFKPKLATVAKVLLFPADTAALGPLVNNVATDSWWGPFMPYKSSLDGQSAKALADAFTSSTGKLWVQSIGSSYSLFEVAKEAFGAAGDPHDKAAVAAPGVGIIQPLGVQWQKGTGKFPFEMQVVDNSLNKDVKITADLHPTNA
jgi:branched-chain amino acid transport system substrate-binding protein